MCRGMSKYAGCSANAIVLWCSCSKGLRRCFLLVDLRGCYDSHAVVGGAEIYFLLITGVVGREEMDWVLSSSTVKRSITIFRLSKNNRSA